MTTASTPRAVGPNPAVTTTSALLVAVAAATVLAAGSGGALSAAPSAATSPPDYAAHQVAAVVSGFLNVGAAVPLLVSAATIANRQQRLGIRVPGPTIGLAGGIAAAVLLGISGLITWSLGSAGVGPGSVSRIGSLLAFAAGGVGFAMALGLFVAGLAIPCLVLRLTPRWFAWIGLVLAVVAELTWFSMVLPSVSPLLPLARFGGLAWIAVAGLLLPQHRRRPRAQDDGVSA